MNKVLLIGLIGLLAHTLSAAESSPQDLIKSATKQLGDKPNYSWTTTIKEGDGSPGRIGPIDGKADKGGLTYLSFMVGGIPVEVYMNGKKGSPGMMAMKAITPPAAIKAFGFINNCLENSAL